MYNFLFPRAPHNSSILILATCQRPRPEDYEQRIGNWRRVGGSVRCEVEELRASMDTLGKLLLVKVEAT